MAENSVISKWHNGGTYIVITREPIIEIAGQRVVSYEATHRVYKFTDRRISKLCMAAAHIISDLMEKEA